MSYITETIAETPTTKRLLRTTEMRILRSIAGTEWLTIDFFGKPKTSRPAGRPHKVKAYVFL